MSPGLNYAVSGVALNQKKIELRNEVVKLFSEVESESPIFTFPGESWITELAIIDAREALGRNKPKFKCLEFDKNIFSTAVDKLPDIGPKRFCYTPRSSRCYKVVSESIDLECCDFSYTDYSKSKFSCAWADFVGPLSYYRLFSLQGLWAAVEDYLVITSLRGRWQDGIQEEFPVWGTIGKYLQSELPNSTIMSEYIYQSTCPMHHVIFRKVKPNVHLSIDV